MLFSSLKKIKNISIVKWLFINFIVMAFAGVVLRYMHVFPIDILNYQFIMHGHSHFAFSAWTFLAVVFLAINELIGKDYSKAFKWILILTIVCSYCMLISFSVSGYKFASILFSTLFLFIGYWFAISIYKKKNLQKLKNLNAVALFKAAIWFLVISSIGPLLLGYLGATEFDNRAILQNCIYFYLHFQMNGWLQLLVLALFFSKYISLSNSLQAGIKRWVYIFIISIIPVFLIFTLWSKPTIWYYVIAFIGALLHMVSWFVIINNIKNLIKPLSLLAKIALLAISLKVVFQVLVCFPFIGEWTFFNRNLIIGYVHLIMLGSVTPLIIDILTQNSIMKSTKQLKHTNIFYVFVTCFYLTILFIQPFLLLFNIIIPYVESILLISAILLMLVGICYFRASLKVNLD
jgi:hypothetical protein